MYAKSSMQERQKLTFYFIFAEAGIKALKNMVHMQNSELLESDLNDDRQSLGMLSDEDFLDDEEKRGSIMRFGKRGSIMRFGKRGSIMRFGKRGSIMRFGKRGTLLRFGRSQAQDTADTYYVLTPEEELRYENFLRGIAKRAHTPFRFGREEEDDM